MELKGSSLKLQETVGDTKQSRCMYVFVWPPWGSVLSHITNNN